MKKIVFFTGSMGRGGAERVISILTREFAKKYETSICLLLFNNVDYELDPKTNIVDMTSKSSNRISSSFFWLKKIRSYVKKEKPDIIVSFSARVGLLTLLSCIGLRSNIFVSERNDPRHDGRGLLINLLTFIFYPRCKGIIFQTKTAQDFFCKRIQKKGVIIPNPIVVNTFHSQCEKGYTKIVNVARLFKQKNQIMLINAFSELAKKYNNIYLHFYGEGYLEGDLKALCERKEISNIVFFHGNIPNIHEQIKDADIFVLSSDYEGQSNALLEAMAMGIPTISTRCAGTECIIDKYNGLLVDVGDENGLKLAIETFINDLPLRTKCGINASKIYKDFEIETVVKKWESIFQQIIK